MHHLFLISTSVGLLNKSQYSLHFFILIIVNIGSMLCYIHEILLGDKFKKMKKRKLKIEKR